MPTKVLGAALLLLTAVTATAHPYHASLAQVELNRATERLEVALKIAPEDFARVVELGLEAAGSDPDRAWAAYLDERFVIHPAGAEPKPVLWIGKEISVEAAWLYFEIPFGGELEGAQMTNTLLFDLEPTQINTVSFRLADRRLGFAFDHETPSRRLAFDQPDRR